MPIIIFSSDSYQKSSELAKKTAETLGYKYVGREILGSVAAKYNIPEAKLTKALDEAPSFFGMSTKEWKQNLAYIREAVLGEMLADNVVCCGLAAHLYVLGVAHVLRVRIIEDPEERVRKVAEQGHITLEKAKKLVQRIDKQRKRRSIECFKKNETDPSMYDMMINTSQIDSEEAVGMVTTAAGYRKFKPMTYSIKCMQDMELEGRLLAVLLKDYPEVRVQARDGAVVVEIKALKREKNKKASAIKELVGKISGVHYVEVHVINDIFRQAAESGR
jgi:cytidylate kinase